MTETKINNVYEFLGYLQKNINAPKSQYNKFGNFNYRNVEDIMEAIKPLILTGGYVYVTDDITQVSDRFYIKATAVVGFNEQEIRNTAFARESLEKKGMDSAQVTGATSSYARKYALGGLLLVDDNKDADSNDNPKTKTTEEKLTKTFESPREMLDDDMRANALNTAVNAINKFSTVDEIDSYIKKNNTAWKNSFNEEMYNQVVLTSICKKISLMDINTMNDYFAKSQATWRAMFGDSFKKITEAMNANRNKDLA